MAFAEVAKSPRQANAAALEVWSEGEREWEGGVGGGVGVGGEWRKVEGSEARGSEGKAARLPKIGPSEQQRPWPANLKT